MSWTLTRHSRWGSRHARRRGSGISTQLCAETLAGIADPLFPALASARVAAPDAVSRAILGGMLEPLEEPAPAEAPAEWLLPHQADAVLRAAAILERFGGVLVSDGVGLGKTRVALALAVLERARGGDAVAVVPAALKGEWSRAALEVGVPIKLHSHTALAREAPSLPGSCSLILVDEAHAFRNPATRRYDALARLAVGRRVALLTATPFNNTPRDLFALIHLFAGRERFRELGVSDLELALRAGDPSAALVMAALSVCRTRRLIEQRFPSLGTAFPRRVLRVPLRHDLEASYAGGLGRLLEALGELASVQAVAEHAAALMHLSLLRRLESSPAALRKSLERHREFFSEVLRASADGVRISRRDLRLAADDGQLAMWPLLGRTGNGEVPASFARCLETALRALDIVRGATAERDDKLRALMRLLDAAPRGQKTLVFTEYRDTALYLLQHLRRGHRVVAVTGERAWGGASTLSRGEALDAFAPASRGAATNALLEADVLVATDVASEGMNLQDARVVVNYDLPWNPVRVMQRVGRIDRLGSPHAAIDVVHLAPAGLGDYARVLRALRAKLEAAGRSISIEPDPLASLWWVEAGTVTPEDVERESWERVAPFEARERWRQALGAPTPRSPWPLVGAALVGDSGPAAVGLLLALEWRDGRRVSLPYVVRPGGLVSADPMALGALALRAKGGAPLPLEPGSLAEALATVLPEARRRLAELSAARRGSDVLGPGRRLALAALNRVAAAARRERADPADAESLFRCLEQDLPAGLDRLLSASLKDQRDPDDAVRKLAAALRTVARHRQVTLEGTPRLRLVAALVLAAGCPSRF